MASLREGLLTCDVTVEGVTSRVGSVASAALGRGIALPAQRELGPAGDAQALVIRALMLSQDTDLSGWVADPGTRSLLESLVALGIVSVGEEVVRPLLAVHPVDGALERGQDPHWYLVHDIGVARHPEHVLGLGGAGATLATITPRAEVASALDLGCGSGIQSLHAARHAGRVVATDTNPRALWLTGLSAGLSGFASLDLRLGSLWEPLAGEAFDLVVANPPFVISPGHQFTYRDAGLPGDQLSCEVVRGAAAHLAPGGRAAILVNWLVREGQAWHERVAGWLEDCAVNAWIVCRGLTSVLDYSLIWLGDAGIDPARDRGDDQADRALAGWLDCFAEQDAHAVGFGWVILARPDAGGGQAWLLEDDLTAASRLPTGAEVAAFLGGAQRVADIAVPELLDLPVRLAEGVVVSQVSTVTEGRRWPTGAAGVGRPGSIGPGGWRGDVWIDGAVLAALELPAERPIGERLDDVAAQLGTDPLDLLPSALVCLRELGRVGLLAGLTGPR